MRPPRPPSRLEARCVAVLTAAPTLATSGPRPRRGPHGAGRAGGIRGEARRAARSRRPMRPMPVPSRTPRGADCRRCWPRRKTNGRPERRVATAALTRLVGEEAGAATTDVRRAGALVAALQAYPHDHFGRAFPDDAKGLTDERDTVHSSRMLRTVVDGYCDRCGCRPPSSGPRQAPGLEPRRPRWPPPRMSSGVAGAAGSVGPAAGVGSTATSSSGSGRSRWGPRAPGRPPPPGGRPGRRAGCGPLGSVAE